MESQELKDFGKIAEVLNSEVHQRIIEFLRKNPDKTLCISEICRELKLNKFRGHRYIRSLNEIKVVHKVEDGSRHLVFLDPDRLAHYENTAKYLSVAMSKRSRKNENDLYG